MAHVSTRNASLCREPFRDIQFGSRQGMLLTCLVERRRGQHEYKIGRL